MKDDLVKLYLFRKYDGSHYALYTEPPNENDLNHLAYDRIECHVSKSYLEGLFPRPTGNAYKSIAKQIWLDVLNQPINYAEEPQSSFCSLL